MDAFGGPGLTPTWSSSAKDLVGCALGPSRLWFTTGFGIVNEVYCPRIDLPQIRDLGFIVADGDGFWVELKRHDNYRTAVPQPGIPSIEIVHTHPRFELRLRLVPDPQRDVLLIEVDLRGDAGLKPYVLLAPHLNGTGHDNSARAVTHRGRRMLCADNGPFALALAAADRQQGEAFGAISVGYVGTSDGWSDFAANGRLTWIFDAAGPGTVAAVGELLPACTLALGIAADSISASTLALAALCRPFEAVQQQHVLAWRDWHRKVQMPSGLSEPLREQLAISAMVLRVHQDKNFPGAMVASLSVPWGNSHDDRGGYHLVWPRDLVESAGALLALGAESEAQDVLRYLIATQLEAGDWSQNQWLGGDAFWQGVQLDEAAYPVLLAAALAERDALDGIEVASMVQRALAFIVCNGPATEQDRWEEDAGIDTFTLAACIAALVCGARWLQPATAAWVLRIADDWNARTEEWTVARNTELCRAHGVAGYYVRDSPSPGADGGNRLDRVLPIRNLAEDPGLAAGDQVATGFLNLVRLGLRRADDPLMVDTLKVIDAELMVRLPTGDSWHRYNGDGYGEQADGSAFDGTGIGRAWPLLTGERGHLELAAGRDPRPQLEAMAAMVGRCGLIPEQVWDAPALPKHRLEPGRPSGSAMPLVWAHAEFVKLAYSIALKRPFDRPLATWQRYRGVRPDPDFAIWTAAMPIAGMRAGQTLHLLLRQPARVHHGIDAWQQLGDLETADTGLGLHAVTLPTSGLPAGTRVDFTAFWVGTGKWQGQDHRVDII